MKFKIDKQEFLKQLGHVQSVVAAKSTLPILSHILIQNNEGKAKINATDLDIGISCEFPVETVEDGAISVPAKRFFDIIREMPEGQLTVVAKKNHQIEVSGGHCRFKLLGLPFDEFPKFPEFKDKQSVSLQQPLLKEMFRMTVFAVSHEDSRYVLNGILVEINGDCIRMVATDGRRLAKIEKPLQENQMEPIKVILPLKAVQELQRHLKDDGVVRFVFGAHQVLFEIDGVLIASRLIDGEFPHYEQVIPDPISPKIKISTQDFYGAVRRAHLLSTPDFQAMRLEVFPNKLVVSKSTPDIGESREEIPIEYGGKEMVVGFNAVYLLDVLKNISDETIALELLGPEKPAVLRLKDYLYLALPVRLG
ncbi:MAG: DNA polymerase III subunit beta [Phycisphaerae bacterium]|nr:MAG: DNA polymerase III subunit beta [Phycisphaerae bacterium]